jgi:CheY-like chemotaxis protein
VRVLLVDDEPDAIELTTAVLAMAGAGVTAVTSTEEALTAVERVKPDVPAE